MAELTRRLAKLRVPLGFVARRGRALARRADAASRWRSAPAIGAIGEALRIWAAGHLEKGREVTTHRARTRSRGIRSTPDRRSWASGFAVAAHSVVVAVLVFAYLAVTITAAIRSEEAHLTEKFGGEYPAYRDGTRVAGARAASASSARCATASTARSLGWLAVLLLLAARMYL